MGRLGDHWVWTLLVEEWCHGKQWQGAWDSLEALLNPWESGLAERELQLLDKHDFIELEAVAPSLSSGGCSRKISGGRSATGQSSAS